MLQEATVSFSEYLRRLARRCLRLSKTAVEPEVIEQMQVWTVELADEADQAERRARRSGAIRREMRERAKMRRSLNRSL
jgi:hypothetical protein